MAAKRAFDIIVVTLAAIVWLPVVLVSALAVLILSGRPIFYRSDRWVGPGALIEMLKLRVMVPDAASRPDVATGDKFLSTVSGSNLYTPIGQVLDKFGLNEIPQFIHVLKGDMSIVGARPLTHDVKQALVDYHRFIDDRWLSPAGLTGLPQLVGRESLTADERLRLEAAYSRRVLQNYQFRVDFKILLYTVLITFGMKRPMTVDEALAVVNRPVRTREMAATRQNYPAIDADVAA